MNKDIKNGKIGQKMMCIDKEIYPELYKKIGVIEENAENDDFYPWDYTVAFDGRGSYAFTNRMLQRV